MKEFKGKAIYNPSGKAGEYSYWACNFYTGCSNNCDYCYLKRGVLSGTWSTKSQLKKCFKDESDAIGVFEKELIKNIDEIRKYGLFFTFTSDPMLAETRRLTFEAIRICDFNNIPVKILTKTGLVSAIKFISLCDVVGIKKNNIAFGFTLTGHDELEKNADPNMERIEAMKRLHYSGFKTFSSIEPIVDIKSSMDMIAKSFNYCDHYKIGLMSGKKYEKTELIDFIYWCSGSDKPIYFKDSFLDQAKIKREYLPTNCVNRDYNIFKA